MRAKCRKTRPLLAVGLFASAVLPCRAQVDLLTPRESAEILEALTQFKESQGRGECPGAVPLAPPTARMIPLQLRGFCPDGQPTGSTTIGDFQVDRSTGAVSVWPSGQPIPVPTEARTLAHAIAAQARSRALSEPEAECVAREAAKGAPGPNEFAAVARGDGRTDHEFEFLALYRLPQAGVTEVRHVLVNTSSLEVLGPDDMPLHTPEVAAILSRLWAAREPALLSMGEAIAVALEVPSVLARVVGTCSPRLSAESGTANTRFIAVENTCAPYPRTIRTIAVVDILHGTVTEPQTQRVLDTPGSVALARELLARARERKAAVQADIQNLCK
jgi:hypothetical protein